MKFNWEIFKQHPYITGIGAVAVFVIVYLMRGSSSGGTASGGTPSTNQYDVQMQQLELASRSQDLQYQAQMNAVNAQAGVQSQAIAAQQDVSKQQSADQLAAINAQVQAGIAGIQAQADVQNTAVQANRDVQIADINSQYAQKQAVIDYLNNTTNQQAAVALAELQSQTVLGSQVIQNQYALQNESLKHIKDVGGSQNRTAIILNSTGNQSGATNAVWAQTASSISGDNLLSRIGQLSSGALGALFG